jgi:hypothetical protein
MTFSWASVGLALALLVTASVPGPGWHRSRVRHCGGRTTGRRPHRGPHRFVETGYRRALRRSPAVGSGGEDAAARSNWPATSCSPSILGAGLYAEEASRASSLTDRPRPSCC